MALAHHVGVKEMEHIAVTGGMHRFGQNDAAETAGAVVGDRRVGGHFGARPQHDRLAAGLEEDGLLEFLAAPAKRFVERA